MFVTTVLSRRLRIINLVIIIIFFNVLTSLLFLPPGEENRIDYFFIYRKQCSKPADYIS